MPGRRMSPVNSAWPASLILPSARSTLRPTAPDERCAAAEVAAHGAADLRRGGIDTPVGEHLGGQDHASSAKAALDGRMAHEGLNCSPVEGGACEALDGLDVPAIDVTSKETARADGRTVD